LEAAFDRVPADWRAVIDVWRQSAEGQALVAFVNARVAAGATVYPAQVLHALELTPLNAVRVVILGQDPYHGAGQAHGLAFSVPDGVRPPPSLRNIFVELKRDLGAAPSAGDLSGWAKQGVLLLNTSLTVEDAQPGSHARQGWEALVEAVVRSVARRPQPCAYLLWGVHAQRFEPLILANAAEKSLQLVLKSNHPSPLAARRPPVPFIGNGHFGQVSRFLAQHGGPIDWTA
jgi:uracil-DNA glycosylase